MSNAENRPGSDPLGTYTLPESDPDQLINVSVRMADATTAVLTVRGEVDMATAPTLRDGIDATLRPGVGIAAIDLSEVTFLASAGLTVLLDGLRTATLRHIAFRLVASGRPVLRTMDAAGLGEVFDRYPTVEAALQQRPESAEGTKQHAP